MGIRIEDSFPVAAPADRVWSYLIDPNQVVACLPGAELLEAQDERNFVGRVRVKVGPVTASYRGKAEFLELDAAARRVRMTGSGQETAGGGSASMSMVSQITELPDGTSEVRIEADLEIVGKLVQFGRGMIEEVSKQLFKQFASCMQAALAQPAGIETPPPEAILSGGVGVGAAAAARANAGAPRAAQKPVSALPLIFRAVAALIKVLVNRLRGRSPTG